MNILFLMADQIITRALSCYGGTHIQTPHLDRLAAEGTQCDNAYCAWPVCSASRASILTGQYAHAHGITQNVDNPELPSITDQTVFTENLLSDRGFATYYIGRWHTGPRQQLTCFKGRTETYRRNDLHRDQLPALITELRSKQPVIPMATRGGSGQWVAPPSLIQQTVEMTPSTWEAHKRWQAAEQAIYPILSVIGRSIIPGQHQPEAILADQAIDRLHAHGDQPFMMTWSVNAPHDPVVVPEPYYSLVPRTEDLLPPNYDSPAGPLGGVSQAFARIVGHDVLLEHIAVYLGMVKMVDDQVGRILTALEKAGRSDDTLVLFTGDHGDMLGGHGMVYKSTQGFFEEITRVPLLMRLPGHIPAGRRTSQVVSLIDLAPTLLDYAGLEIPHTMQGMSLCPLLEGRTNQAPHIVMCQRHGGRMVRAGDWKYAWHDTGQQWLFNVAKDPGETINRHNDPAFGDVLKQMRAYLNEEMTRTDDPLRDTIFPD